MTGQQHPFHPEITLTKYWPALKPVNTSDVKDSGRWELMISPGGSVALWDSENVKAVPGEYVGEYRTFYRSDDREMLERFFVSFCRRGYEKDAKLTYQDGQVWIFNWRSFTDWQVGVARRVAHLYFNDQVEEAWTFGKWAQDQINAAEVHEGGPDGKAPQS